MKFCIKNSSLFYSPSIIVGLFLTALLVGISCKKDYFQSTPEGYSVTENIDHITHDSVIDIGDYFLVDGDMLIPKNEDRQFSTNNLVDRKKIQNIRVFVNSSIPSQGVDNWRSAVASACSNWNSIDHSLIKFEFVTSGAADITVKSDDGALANNVIAAAPGPSSAGMPGNVIIVNLDFFNNTEVPEGQKIFNMVHELGHTIGFLHSNETGGTLIYGTPSFQTNSVMTGGTAFFSWENNQFNEFDIFAAQMLYYEKYLPGNSWDSEGSDVAMGSFGGGSAPDLVFMNYDAATGSNSFRYRILYDLNSSGIGASLSPIISIPGVGDFGDGAGITAGRINNNNTTDFILMADDNPSGPNSIRYRVAFDINTTTGISSSVSSMITVPGTSMSWESAGAGCSLAQIDNNPLPDLLVMICDNGSGMNEFRYKIGWNLNSAGVASSWSDSYYISGVAMDTEGAGVVVANIDINPRPEIIFMGYDASDPNQFVYKIGKNISTSGTTSYWGMPIYVPGISTISPDAGITLGNLNGGELDMILMAEDNPTWQPNHNHFRFMIGYDINSEGEPFEWQY